MGLPYGLADVAAGLSPVVRWLFLLWLVGRNDYNSESLEGSLLGEFVEIVWFAVIVSRRLQGDRLRWKILYS